MSEFEKVSSNQQPQQQGLDLGRALGVGGPEIKEVDKAENFKATVIRLVKYLKPQYPMLIAMILIAAIGAWFAIWVPDIMKKVTNALVDSIQYFVLSIFSFQVGSSHHNRKHNNHYHLS